MPTELLSLAKIFNNRLFRIPDYQRGFAWGERQLSDFWSDLQRAASGRNHYCSQLTIERAPDDAWQTWNDDRSLIEDANFEPCFVVDGQQRLTTAVVLIQALLDGLPPEQSFAGLTVADQQARFLVKPAGLLKHCLFGYSHDNPSHEYFRTQILGVPSNEYNGIRTVYTGNLGFAHEFFRGKVTAAKESEARERWFRALTQKFLFNVYELTTDLDVFVAFETMNNRGKPLTRLELLKNRLIYLSTLAPGTEPERKKVRSNINAVWKTIYEELGRQPDSALDDDEFLRAHWIGYFGYDKDEADPLTQFLLNKHFTADRLERGELKLTDIQAYIDSLQTSVRSWQWLHFPEKHEDKLGATLSKRLERLSRLGFGVLKPLFLAVLSQDAKEDQKVEVVSEAERFLLLVRSLGGARSHVGENESYRTAHDLFQGGATLNEATAMLRERVARHFNTQIFQTEIDDLYLAKDGKGFYDLPGVGFILFEYEEYLRLEAKAVEAKIVWGQFRGARNSIEHVYPQQAQDADWAEFAAYTPDQRRFLCHSLGNLVAVSVAKNAALSRSSFADKVKGTDRIPGFSQGSFSELRIAQNPKWTSEEISTRGLELLSFIERRWGVLLGDDAAKLKLLKLEFLLPKLIV
jgi:hypothetical protein